MTKPRAHVSARPTVVRGLVAHQWLNIGCGPHRAPEPWWNVDVIDNDVVHPDQVVDADNPIPFPDSSAERVYLGHVLEHVPWNDVPDFLARVKRVLQPGGQLVVVGPDVPRTLERWRAGLEPQHIVDAVLEGAGSFQPSTEEWPQARHWWNCSEARIVGALDAAGFEQITPLALDGSWADGWPVVAWSLWQCAVSAVRP